MIITDIKVQKRNKNMRSIFVDNKYCFSLEDIDLYKLKLKTSQQISSDDIESYKTKYEYSKARDKALRYVTYKKRSIKEVEDKLMKLGYFEETICKVIDKLLELKYLDDNDYTQSFIKEKIKLKPCGKKLLRYELKNRGIEDSIIEKNVESIEIDEYETALELAKKKYSNIKIFDEKNKRKIYSFLLRRGFSNSIAITVIKELQIKSKDGNYEL